MDHSRLARIEGSDEDGTFSMILATSGEASDGHILDIGGGIVPERMPLLLSHQNDPRSQIGSVVSATRARVDGQDVLRATGQIELGGEGAQADIRRDVFHMIRAGHIGAVSLRWDPLKAVARADLPEKHPARVTKSEPDSRKRFGLYFSSWRALEGSVVSVGADPAALIGRSRETTGEVAEFWRQLAADSGRVVPIEQHEAALARISELEERLVALAPPALVAETPAPPAVDVAEIVARTVRAAVSDYEKRLEERMRAYVRETFGRLT